MQYVVLDLEWNQSMSPKNPIHDYLPIRLLGEIIQIGAVKLNERFEAIGEFQIDVRPIYFRKIHYKVKKLTGFDMDRLSGGESFSDAIKKFLDWCGQDCIFLTWGCDDFGIMEQNLIIHDLDIDWLGKWINLQVIFNLQIESSGGQKSLKFAMEHFNIEQTRTAHDALGDAYNTSLICQKLDIGAGLDQYDDAPRILALRQSKKGAEIKISPDKETELPAIAIEQRAFREYISREDIWKDEKLYDFPCPICQKDIRISKWLSLGNRRYMSLAACSKHGSFILRLRLKLEEDGLWTANRIAYCATDEMLVSYKKKSKNPRHNRRHGNKKLS